jgi:hypothetical protein
MSLIIVNDFVKNFRSYDPVYVKDVKNALEYNIDKHAAFPYEHDDKGVMYIDNYRNIQVYNNRKEPIDILESDIKKDRFDRSYGELKMAFSYPIFKKVLEDIKAQYGDTKIYCDLKRIYTNKPCKVHKVSLKMFYNKNKNTINIMLYA